MSGLTGTASSANDTRDSASDTREFVGVRRLLDRLQRRRNRRGLPAPQVLLSAPGLRWAYGAQGQVFDGASIGKVFTAVLIMRHVESGRLLLDDPVTKHLPARELRGLFEFGGIDYAPQVTVAQLLSHTSGAADFFDGKTVQGPSFQDAMVAESNRFWTPADLLAFSREFQQPVGLPGQRFGYSDTGYVLLGRIIEEIGSAALATQLHDQIFEPLAMVNSSMVGYTVPGGAPAGAGIGNDLGLAPIVIAGVDISRRCALSLGWGGGGVAGTPADFMRFSQALHAGDLISPASRARMAMFENRLRPGIYYGAGLSQVRYGKLSPFFWGIPNAVGGIGITAAHMYAVPDRDIHLVINFHSTAEMMNSFRVNGALVRAAMAHASARKANP